MSDGISVTVKLFGDVRKYMKRGEADLRTHVLPTGITVGELAARIGATSNDELIIGVNGEQGERSTVLRDGDSVLLVSPMEGG